MESRRARRGNEKESPKSVLWSYVRIVIVAVAIALLLRTFVIFPVVVDGPSMEDTLQSGNVVMVEKISLYTKNIQRFDVVILQVPGRDKLFVKRVVALGGEKVAVTDGYLMVNGERIDDPHNTAGAGNINSDYEECTVPEGYVFVMGDNRNDSMDSRSFGAIPVSSLKGKGIIRIWPLSAITTLH